MPKLVTQAVFLTCFVLLAGYSSAQTYSDHISDKEITLFFKQLSGSMDPKIKSMDEELIDWTYPDLYGERDTLYQMGWLTRGIFQNDTVLRFFDTEDLGFVKKQYDAIAESTWHENHFMTFELVDTIFYRKILSHSYNSRKIGKWYAHSFSLPLFSIEKNHVIIQQEYYCGYMCSKYCVYLYEKVTDEKAWKLIAKWKCIKM